MEPFWHFLWWTGEWILLSGLLGGFGFIASFLLFWRYRIFGSSLIYSFSPAVEPRSQWLAYCMVFFILFSCAAWASSHIAYLLVWFLRKSEDLCSISTRHPDIPETPLQSHPRSLDYHPCIVIPLTAHARLSIGEIHSHLRDTLPHVKWKVWQLIHMSSP